jgi:hypothetical protein
MKSKTKKVFFFVLTVLGTLIITSVYNKVFPSDPNIVKEVTDSLTVVHKYNFPVTDSMNLEIEKRLKNIELLNSYENEIDKKLTRYITNRAFSGLRKFCVYLQSPLNIKFGI